MRRGLIIKLVVSYNLFISVPILCTPNSNRHPGQTDQTSSVRVRTKLGEIQGTVVDVNGQKVYAFLGVPFAQPPIADLRFQPPAPIVKPWSGLYGADEPAKSCYQASDLEYEDFRGSDMWNTKTEKSEDCLYMNIWVPAGVENATTMVWLYGGGFWYGSASLDVYNGLGLTAEGRVIVVAPNYRMGVFGFLFLDHPQMPGNLGLLDQQMAMKWVQQNIAAFNGDPKKVTLFGESAGAASVAAHLVSPTSWSLFRNAILQSGTLDNPWAMDTPVKAASKSWMVVRRLGCVQPNMLDTVQCLKNKSASELDDAMWSNITTLGYLEFPLVIVSKDRAGFFNSDAYESLRRGRYRPNTDLMFGSNQNEGTFWMVYYGTRAYFDPFKYSTGSDGEQKFINGSVFSECINEVIFKKKPQVYKSAALWEYRDNGQETCPRRSVADPAFYRDQLDQVIGNYYFTCDSIWLADEVVRRKMGRVYVYHFEQRVSTNPWPKWMGVMHGYEIEYVFGLPLLSPSDQSLVNGSGNHQNLYNYSPEDRAFSKEVVHYWATFARTGSPNSRNSTNNAIQADWPEYNLKNKPWYVLRSGRSGHSLYRQKESECKMWRSIRDIEYHMRKATYL